MKNFFVLICIINFYSISFGQVYELRFNDCGANKTYKTEREFYIWDNINKSFDTLRTNKKGSINFSLPNPSSSSIVYYNKYNQFMKVNAGFLKTSSTNYICYDSLMFSHHPFIDQLKVSDTLKISFHARGCFILDSCNLMIIKSLDKTVLKLYKGGKLRDSKTLTNKDIETFRLFEIELINHQTSKGNCSHEQEHLYLIKYKTERKHISDRTCNWSGIYGLLDKYGLK